MSSDELGQVFSLAEIVGLVRRRGLALLMSPIIGCSIGYQCAYLLPTRFKSKATITIQAGYFHHPLISDVVAEIQDTGEMSAHRLSLVKSALTDQFLDSFGRKHFFPPAPGSQTLRPLDPEAIIKTIEYFSTNPTTFQVSVTADGPDKAFQATQEVLHQIASSIALDRRNKLLIARQALITKADELLVSFSENSPAPSLDNLRADLSSTEAKLAELGSSLSASHPDVISMKARLNSLRSQITDTPPVSKEVRGPLPPIFYARQSRLATQEIFDDLLKKIIGLSVVIETERGQTYGPYIDIIEHPRVPMWSFSPNKIHISLIGTAVGLLLGLAYSAVLELKSLSDISPAEAERFLEVSFLGELPRLQHHDA